jgi:predicted RNA-binding Zn-ribbon protein involved in translation (DUF1610 family)
MPRQLTCPHCDYHPISPPLAEAERAELERLSQAEAYRTGGGAAFAPGEVDTSGKDWARVRCPNCGEVFYFNKRTGRLSR